jgi:hypothetical protein
LALTLQIELFTQSHYKESIQPDGNLSELYKDVFLYHWKEEATHAIMDEVEWPREDKKLNPEERDQAVSDLIELVAAVDGILRDQSAADVDYFLKASGRFFSDDEVEILRAGVHAAYRWQYIISGVEQPRFKQLLESLITEEQGRRIQKALEPILQEAGR